MVSYQQIVENGKKVDEWERGVVVEYKDKYFWINPKEEKIVMKGNFL
ncbi:MAG: hypothetical protein ACLFTQ_03685 [Candidatus Aenigmatarchaeota archaeon]